MQYASPLKMGPDRLSRNVDNYQSTLRNIPEEGTSYLLLDCIKTAV
jgi:hypothetical protein